MLAHCYLMEIRVVVEEWECSTGAGVVEDFIDAKDGESWRRILEFFSASCSRTGCGEQGRVLASERRAFYYGENITAVVR